MPKLKDVCHHIRSKNAGPFWVTFDLFFKSPDMFEQYKADPALGPQLFAKTFGTNPDLVRYYPVASLSMVKISYPRPSPQGGLIERDMHSGQQYVRILDVELSQKPAMTG
ncbi:MAG: DUF4387 domain-containing protein [Hyphomonadaceae bacterium]|nr:DUF4387 domain-containing protein [Hyphomonadaceae bacterium]